MRIDLTKEQYDKLIELVYVGNLVINGNRLQDEQIKKYNEVEQHIYSFFKRIMEIFK